MSRTLTETTVRTFQRVLATAERLLERIDNLEGRMTREEIALLRRILDGEAEVKDAIIFEVRNGDIVQPEVRA